MGSIASILDYALLIFFGAWAYLVAKRKQRDEVGWAIVAVIVFFLPGYIMEQALFEKLAKGCFGWSEEIIAAWKKPSGFLFGSFCALLLDLYLTFFVLPLPPSEEPKGGEPPAGAPPGGEGERGAPSEQKEAEPAQAAPGGTEAAGPPEAQASECRDASRAELAQPAPATSASADPWTLLTRFWPSGIIVLLYLVTQVEEVREMLKQRGYEPPYPPVREVALLFLVPTQVWLLWRRWPETVLSTLFVAAYVPAINWMEYRWSRGSDYFSHGYLIPLVVVWLVWMNRRRLALLEPRGDFRFWGLVTLGFGLLLLLLGARIRMDTLQGISFVVVLCGLVFFLYGRAISKVLLFPLLFTFVMVPLPMFLVHRLSFDLKMLASRASVGFVRLLGTPGARDHALEREGSYIKWKASDAVQAKCRRLLAEMEADGRPEGEGKAKRREELGRVVGEQKGVETREDKDKGKDMIIVEDACSGLRSLIALIAFGALFAYIAKLSLPFKLVLFAAAVPIALLANMWRIVTLILVACLWGSVEIHGWAHDLTGWGIFAVAFVLFFGFERLLRKLGPREPGDAAPQTLEKAGAVGPA
jgi:exosortase/archaeosortase family protein